jgi:hypothetical protein
MASRLALLLLAVPLACGMDDRTSDTAGSTSTSGLPGTTGGPPQTTGPLTDATGTLEGSGDLNESSGGPPAPGTTTTTGDDDTGVFTTGAPATTGGSTGDTDGISDCDELVAAFEAEALEIRSCAGDGECGQELTGTSCGCTRNWVARTDADTAEFYALIDKAAELGCELFLAGTCDCPPADGFVCLDGICAWNYL